MNSDATILVSCFQDPVVATNIMRGRHDVFGRSVPRQKSTELRSFLSDDALESLGYVAKVHSLLIVRFVCSQHLKNGEELLEKVLNGRLLSLGDHNLESDRCVIKKILIMVLKLRPQIAYKLVFPRQLFVALKVIYQMFRAKKIGSNLILFLEEVHRRVLAHGRIYA